MIMKPKKYSQVHRFFLLFIEKGDSKSLGTVVTMDLTYEPLTLEENGRLAK
jgi:hypothetical protein